MADGRQIILMDGARIRRTLKRIVYQIAEKAHGRDVLMIGLNDRGGAVAREMGEYLSGALEQSVEVHSFYVHDEADKAEGIRNRFDFTGKMVVLVDDVIFSGRTMFAALQTLLQNLDCTVYTAVLIDRGHRTLPVQAGFVGLEIPTKPNEHVELTLKQNKADTVNLYRTL